MLTFLGASVGAQWELPAAVARRHQRHVFGFFPIPVRTRAFCRYGDLGSSNRPFSMKAPRSNGSACESSGSNVAGGRETALQPHCVHPPRWHPSSLEAGCRPQSKVVRDYLGAGDWTTAGEPPRPNRRGVSDLRAPSSPRSRLLAAVRAKARWIHRSGSSTSMRSGCCRYSFEKQPEGRSRISAKGVRASRCVPAETESPRKALVSARQRASQFPLRPYSQPQIRSGILEYSIDTEPYPSLFSRIVAALANSA